MVKKIALDALQVSDTKVLALLANNRKIWDNLRDYIPYPYSENDATTFIMHTKEEDPQQGFGIR